MILRLITLFIFVQIFVTVGNTTDLPKNYKEGIYTQSFKDNLLVAQNDNTDSKFYKSVIILLEHDEKGAFGFAVNKFLGEYPLSSLVSNNNNIKETDKKKLDKLTLPIYWGGPVDENRIFVLHTNEYKSKSTKIFNSLSVTNDLQILIDISENKGPKENLILIGISGWGENQLEGELDRNQWSLGEFDLNLIFNDENKSKWDLANKRVFVPL